MTISVSATEKRRHPHLESFGLKTSKPCQNNSIRPVINFRTVWRVFLTLPQTVPLPLSPPLDANFPSTPVSTFGPKTWERREPFVGLSVLKYVSLRAGDLTEVFLGGMGGAIGLGSTISMVKIHGFSTSRPRLD